VMPSMRIEPKENSSKRVRTRLVISPAHFETTSAFQS
jgi:hypothetical protein